MHRTQIKLKQQSKALQTEQNLSLGKADNLSIYKFNPIDFAQKYLGYVLTPDQKTILTALTNENEVNVQSSHGQGKTFLAAITVLWWLFCWHGIAVTTAPNGRQVKDLLWSEIRKLHGQHKDKLGGDCLTLQLKYLPDSWAIGFSAENTDENGSQGYHAENLLIIEDEACGISEAVDNGLVSCLTGSNNKILRIGNPVEPQTPFEGHCKRKVIKLPAWSHPNVNWAYILKSDGIHRLRKKVKEAIYREDGTLKSESEWGVFSGRTVVHGAVSIRWIETIRETKTEASPYWLSRVEAEFPGDSESSLVSRELFKAARARYDANPDYWDELANLYLWRHGVDVGDGLDPHACVSWRGSVLYAAEEHQTFGDRRDTARCVKWIKGKLQAGTGQAIIDRTGVGAGTLSGLLEDGQDAVGVAWSESADDPKSYRNLKAEQCWKLRLALQDGHAAIAPLGEYEDRLAEELAAIHYTEDLDEKIVIEAKKLTKVRLKRSPNLADATIIGFARYEAISPLFGS